VASGTLGDLLGQTTLRLQVSELPADRAPLAAFGPLTDEGGWITIRPLDPERIPDVVATVVAMGGRVHAVDPARRSLEDLFLGLVREDDRDAAPPSAMPDEVAR
jgi:ABC-2 type transport system ATP-binding protein